MCVGGGMWGIIEELEAKGGREKEKEGRDYGISYVDIRRRTGDR